MMMMTKGWSGKHSRTTIRSMRGRRRKSRRRRRRRR